MNYSKIYNQLIDYRKSNIPTGYVEKHHITPVSLGGSNEKSNIVKLTAKEHFLAHRLLAKIHGGKMWAALAYMSRGTTKSAKGVFVNSRLYEYIKLKDAQYRSCIYSGSGNPYYGKFHSKEIREKMKKPKGAWAGKKHPTYGMKRPEHHGFLTNYIRIYKPFPTKYDFTVRDRIDNLIVKRPKGLFELHRHIAILNAGKRDKSGDKNPNWGNGQAISGEKNPMYGKQHKESTKIKIGNKARRTLDCPYCGKTANIANAHRWHFGNCKKKNAQITTPPI